MGNKQLTESEQKLFTLFVVKECLNYAKENEEAFENVLKDVLFPGESNFSRAEAEMICNNIKTLNVEGYIEGEVELVNEREFDEEMNESETDDINFEECEFENIKITPKGKAYMGMDGVKNVTKEFWEKVKPMIKELGIVAVNTAVETGIVALLRMAGFPV